MCVIKLQAVSFTCRKTFHCNVWLGAGACFHPKALFFLWVESHTQDTLNTANGWPNNTCGATRAWVSDGYPSFSYSFLLFLCLWADSSISHLAWKYQEGFRSHICYPHSWGKSDTLEKYKSRGTAWDVQLFWFTVAAFSSVKKKCSSADNHICSKINIQFPTDVR